MLYEWAQILFEWAFNIGAFIVAIATFVIMIIGLYAALDILRAVVGDLFKAVSGLLLFWRK